MTDKRGLRETLLERRAGLDETTVVTAGRALADRVRTVVREHGARAIAAYLSVGHEPSTWLLLDALVADGVSVVVPRALAHRRLTWAAYAGPDALTTGRFGIPEPVAASQDGALRSVDLIVVPALAVDRAGFRLGRGGGYYDTALAAHPAPVRVALVYDHEVVDDIGPEQHDQRVDLVVTPARTLVVGAGRLSPPGPASV